jgi:twinkle protein
LGCSFIILDHISIVVSGLDFGIGDNERQMIDRLLTKLRSLVEETGCGIQAIVHLKRKNQSRGRGYNEGGRISLSDLRGSGSLEQLSDAVIGMERDQQDEGLKHLSRLRVLKCRRTGDTGEADILEYSPMTGRLLATDLRDFPGGEETTHAQTGSTDF